MSSAFPHQPSRRGIVGSAACRSWTNSWPGAPGSAVEVLVRAPGSGVDVPVVERQRHVAHGMGEVPQRDRPDAVRGTREPLDVQALAGRVADAGEQRHRQPVALRRDRRLDILVPQQVLALARAHDHELGRRVEAVEPELRRHDVPVARERRGVHEDPRPGAGGPEERGQQQVEVDAQRVAGRDLGSACADEPRRAVPEPVLVSDPRRAFLEPAVDAAVRPLVELPRQRLARRHRLRPSDCPARYVRGVPSASRGSRNRDRSPASGSAASSAMAWSRAAFERPGDGGRDGWAQDRAGSRRRSRGDGGDRADRERPRAPHGRRQGREREPVDGQLLEARSGARRSGCRRPAGSNARAAPGRPSRRCSRSRCRRAPRLRARGGRRRPR